MNDAVAVDALISDLHWQIDQMRSRGIKNRAGDVYNPSYYKRGLDNAIDRGGLAVVEYVRGYLLRPPSDGFEKLEAANSLDLACEWLVRDATRPYAHLFTEQDRATASERLAPHVAAIDEREAERRTRIEAARVELRAKGLPPSDLDSSLRTRQRP